jgi:hypothetical protein
MRARLTGLAVVTLTATVTALSTHASGDPVAEDDHGAAAAGCAVTKTQVADVPRTPYGPTPGWIVGDGLWLTLNVDTATVFGTRPGQPDQSTNTYPGTLRANGSVGVKWLWRRAKRGSGRLWIMGHSQPESTRFRIDTGTQYPRRKFVPSGVIFPSAGCWSIAVKSGNARLNFVAWVAVAP